MYNNANVHSDDDDDANALIDSYFLPGGILDPEDTDTKTENSDELSGTNHNPNHGQSMLRMDHSDATKRTQPPSLDVHSTESLRSRIDQLSLGGQSLQYNSGLHHSRSHNFTIGAISPQSHEASRLGVSGLDPTLDDVVGGRPILMGTSLPTTSPSLHQLPSPSIAALSSETLHDYKGDWFSDRNTRNAPENDLSNILRGTFQSSSTAMAPLSSPSNTSKNESLQPQDRQTTYTSYSSTSNDESRTTSATSHVRRNPWSNEDLSKVKQVSSSQLSYGGNFPESSVSMKTPIASPSTSNRPFHDKQAISRNSSIPVTMQSIRPPPGFHSSSPQVGASLGQRDVVRHDPASKYNTKQIPIESDSRENSNSFQEQRLARDDLQPNHSDAQLLLKNKIAHHNDGDYDLSSLNTKSSRDVPSTIYVEDDDVSTSEDTLTVCADSVTEASAPRNNIKLESERNCMDVVEEISAAEMKRSKSKRSKKKRSKKKYGAHESIQSQGTLLVDTIQDEAATAKFEHNEHKSNNEEESKKTRRHSKEASKETDNPSSSVRKAQAISKASAATTAASSTVTTVQRVIVKRNAQIKSFNEKPLPRSTEKKSRLDVKEREPLTEVISKWFSDSVPSAISAAISFLQFSITSAKGAVKICLSWFPKKERFWFLLPVCCITVDFFFLTCTMIFKAFGQMIYIFLMAHKLAIIELMESEYAAICYSVIFFYPEIVKGAKHSITYQDYWPIFARWVAIDRWFCRPITMKETYLYLLKEESKNENTVKIVKIRGNHLFRSLKAAVDHIVRKSKEDKPDESERVTMANHILLILRKVTPLILMLEVNIQQEGFLVLMTSTERILFGYGFAVLRSGYLFSPLIWISWTIQLTIIMFAHPNAAWSYFIFLMGLVSIRLSHYSAAVEDLEGVQGLNSHATSKRRKKVGCATHF